MDALLSKLEYNQVIQIIQEHCKTYLGKKLCLELKPRFKFSEVENLLLEAKEATTLL